MKRICAEMVKGMINDAMDVVLEECNGALRSHCSAADQLSLTVESAEQAIEHGFNAARKRLDAIVDEEMGE